MIAEKKERRAKEEAEEVKEILAAVSTEIPALVKGIIGAIFSEESGKDMGRAAGAFYKELKESGMPDDVAVKMTQNYIGVFTSLGDMLKQVMSKKGIPSEKRKEIEEEIAKKIKEKMAEKTEKKTEISL